MIRQFRLQGIDTGDIISLNDFNKFLLTLPDGLGFEYKNTFLKVGNQRLLVKKEYEFTTISGTIEVSGNTRLDWEKNYNELKRFIASNKKSGFKLYYKSTQEPEKYIICNIKLLSKTEKSSYAILIPISLEPRTLWEQDFSVKTKVLQSNEETENLMVFKENDTIINEDDNVSVNDRFDFSYNYGFKLNSATNEYSVNFVISGIGYAELNNDGDEEVPLKIIINQNCTEPLITIYDNNGNIVQQARLLVSLYDGDTLTLNSDAENLFIRIVRSTGVVEDVTTKIDLSFKNFLTLPVGEYIINIIDGASNPVNATIEFSKRYLGG